MRNRRRGTNLFEVVLALAFCSMALLAVLSVQGRTHQALRKNSEREKAHNIALSLQAEAANALTQDFNLDPRRPREPYPEDPQFEVGVEVDPNDVAAPTLKKVTVTVWYQDRQGEQKVELWCYYDAFQ